MKRLGLWLALAVLGVAGLGAVVAGNVWAGGAPGPAQPAVSPVFGPNVRANSDATQFGQHEPSLAVSRVNTNTVVTAQKDYRNGDVKQVWINVSTDGGATWPVDRQLQMPGIPAQYNIQSDPVVMARDDGRIYVACLATNTSQSNGAVFLTWSDDNGATWRNPSVLISPNDPYLDDKDWFAIDNNPASPYYRTMYMMYAPSAAYVVEQHSTDGGITWSARQTISGSNTEYTYPVVGSDGTVYNFMMQNWGANQLGTVQLTKSTNGGVTWSAPAPVTTADQPSSPIRPGDQFRFFAILSAAVDPNTSGANTTLYVAWTDRRNFAGNGTDVVYVKSSNAGSTWGPVTRLSHDPPGTQRDHITPMILVGADSKVHAFWLDRRLAASANGLFDSWYSSSTDGGATWDADTRVSTQSQDLNLAFPPGSGNAAGDYWGLDTAQDTVYVAWNDTRSGNQDILVSKGLMPGAGGPTATATRTVAAPSATVPLPSPTATRFPSATATVTGATSTATPGLTPSVTPVCGVGWRVAQQGTDFATRDVAVISATDIWALGNGDQLYHWNGTTWTNVAHPPPLFGPATLVSLSAAASNDVWAAGYYGSNSVYYAWMMHWDGAAWTFRCCIGNATGPTGGVNALDFLSDVAALGGGAALAVGTRQTEAGPIVKLGIYCTSGNCTISEGGPGSYNAISDNAVWNVGVAGGVSLVDGPYAGAVPNVGPLTDVAAVTTNSVWATGATGIIRWDGTAWAIVAAPAPVGGGWRAVDGVAADDVWAVNGDGTLYHWDGTTWTAAALPGILVGGVDMKAAGDGWAWGLTSPGNVPVILRYNGGQTFEDVPTTNPFYAYIEWMACRGYISGYTCGGPGEACVPPGNRPYFRPGNPVTRGQLLKMVVNAASWPVVNPPESSRTFEDVPPANPFYLYIETGASHGIISGYGCGGPGEPCVPPQNRPYFRPAAQITRGQLSKVIALARGYSLTPPATPTFADVPDTQPFYLYIEAVAAQGIVSGYGCGGPGEPCDPSTRPYFRPGANATRGQVSKFVTLAYGGP